MKKLFILSALSTSLLSAQSEVENHQPVQEQAKEQKSMNNNEVQLIQHPVAGIQYAIIQEGKENAPIAKKGQTVRVHYVGTLTSGKEFDSSRKREAAFEFQLGAGHVIRGWDEGVAGMRIGEIRKLVLAPEVAYGNRGIPGVIPANSTLIFEVELLEVR